MSQLSKRAGKLENYFLQPGANGPLISMFFKVTGLMPDKTQDTHRILKEDILSPQPPTNPKKRHFINKKFFPNPSVRGVFSLPLTFQDVCGTAHALPNFISYHTLVFTDICTIK